MTVFLLLLSNLAIVSAFESKLGAFKKQSQPLKLKYKLKFSSTKILNLNLYLVKV